ncbi:MAG: mannose-1-phosphate guanylyltransferase [Bacteroidales bacterium]|nr:mannose-1-phosphate guanylyltransferase [Bacteroidales bacterium]
MAKDFSDILYPKEKHKVDSHLWCIIMAGGIGSRFWPISTTDSPKQFIDTMGTGESLLQFTFNRFAMLCPRENIIMVTGEQYVDRVHEQLSGLQPYQVLSEPLRRNTAPCVAYAASVIAHLDPQATIIVSPSDHAVFRRERFCADLRQAVATVRQHEWIITLGALPVRPDTSYGYIQFQENPSLPNAHNLHKVVTFTEKPPLEMARQFIASGEFFWNAGIFVWTLPVLQKAYEVYLPSIAETFFKLDVDASREELEEVYSHCEAISIDNGIMEKAENVHVMEASFGWSDVETWDSLYGVFRHDKADNAIINGNVFTYDTRNCLVIMPQGKTAVLEGLDGYIVVANDDTLMVCRRKNEDKVFKFSSDVELKKLLKK